jgi:hypothetical protein
MAAAVWALASRPIGDAMRGGGEVGMRARVVRALAVKATRAERRA